MKALEVTKDVYWVGTRDYDIEVFDVVLKTEKGTTYNSYVIKGKEKTALIDICKEEKYDEYIERLSSVIDIRDIDYIITNHTEPDHSGSLHKILELNPNLQIYGTRVALRYLREIVNFDFNGVHIEKNPTLDLGGYTLNFIPAPFLHWPDSMMTHCPELKVLFSCDMFGCHFCTEEIFNDLIKEDFSYEYKYYFDCIFKPYSKFVLEGVEKIKDLDIEIIANGHGPVLRKDLKEHIDKYSQWAIEKKDTEPTVVIPFVTSYGYTRDMAKEITRGLESVGVKVLVYDMVYSNKDEVLKKINTCDGVLFGSCTIMSDALPPIYELLYEMNPIIHKGLLGGAFGSYGWSGEAVPNIEARLAQLRLKKPLEGLRVLFRPTDVDVTNCFKFGVNFGNEVLAKRLK
ncbi:MAG: FprA family A-type flavoprotein [Lachnospirales bacterium]